MSLSLVVPVDNEDNDTISCTPLLHLICCSNVCVGLTLDKRLASTVLGSIVQDCEASLEACFSTWDISLALLGLLC